MVQNFTRSVKWQFTLSQRYVMVICLTASMGMALGGGDSRELYAIVRRSVEKNA